MYSTLLLEHNGPTATITFNRPEKRNAISPKMMCDLQSALDEIEKDRTRVAILTGAGQRVLRRHGSRNALCHGAAVSPGKSGGFATACAFYSGVFGAFRSR